MIDAVPSTSAISGVARTVTAQRDAIASMMESARNAGRLEACGALLGNTDFATNWQIRIALSLPNNASEPERYYLIPADTVRALERTAEASGMQVIGFFHSHPQGEPSPSPTDRDQAWPGYVYAIVDPAADAVRWWTLDPDDGSFHEVGLSP